MTDKQIIIDGVDVSGCEKQGETIAGITCGNGERIRLANEIITKYKLCKDNPNCVYKQLQREKQTSQEARDTAIKEFNRAEELKTLLKSKEQECEKLRFPMPDTNYAILTKEEFEQLDQLKSVIKKYEECNKYLVEENGKTYTRLEYKLLRILTEIKGIAEVEIECKTYEIENDCFNETRCKALNEHIDFTKQILQKIKECEVENEN